MPLIGKHSAGQNPLFFLVDRAINRTNKAQGKQDAKNNYESPFIR